MAIQKHTNKMAQKMSAAREQKRGMHGCSIPAAAESNAMKTCMQNTDNELALTSLGVTNKLNQIHVGFNQSNK